MGNTCAWSCLALVLQLLVTIVAGEAGEFAHGKNSCAVMQEYNTVEFDEI